MFVINNIPFPLTPKDYIIKDKDTNGEDICYGGLIGGAECKLYKLI